MAAASAPLSAAFFKKKAPIFQRRRGDTVQVVDVQPSAARSPMSTPSRSASPIGAA